MSIRNLFLMCCVVLSGCAVKKTPPNPVVLKPLKISGKNKIFRQRPTKTIDITHTELNVSFDWNQHICHGREKITFTPYHYPIDSFKLDAKNFIIKNIQLEQKNSSRSSTPFRKRYNQKQLSIYLAESIQTGDTLVLSFDYDAYPDKNTGSGSQAIKDDKGLYFINTAGKEPYKPMQLWTQGETESNSNWFATIDKPHEKMTFDINITMADSLISLSNGLLTKQEKNGALRTDYWNVKKPMSAYLVMMAIGKFEKTIDVPWKGKEISYYLESPYHPYATNIFKHTPEMIKFFSSKVGFAYPWQKYSQIVVRDFVSGAMENTSATLHGSFVQKNNRELIDKQNDGIVAHELFHHWFGDLVTCDSWSHLTLNEGFATFGEQLWFAHKYGSNAELVTIYKSMNSYLNYSNRNDKSIVRFYYNDKDDLFNPITYQKGARVLNLLKFELGDESFFRAIKNYLNTYQYKTAQIEQLRHEFEKVSGKELRLFFKQWFHTDGHPNITVQYNRDSTQLIIEQTQKKDLFDFPFQYRAQDQIETIRIHKKKTKIAILKTDATKGIYLDPNCIFIGRIDNKLYDKNATTSYFAKATNYIEKMRIIDGLPEKKEDYSLDQENMLLQALKDKNPDISQHTMHVINWKNTTNSNNAKESLKEIAQFSTNPKQKSQAIMLLGGYEDELLLKDFIKWSQDSSYQVAAAGLYGIKKIRPSQALEIAKLLETDAKAALFTQVCNLYAESANAECTYFEKQLMKRWEGERNLLINAYAQWAKRQEKALQDQCWHTLLLRAKNDDNKWTRYVAMKSLGQLAKENKNSSAAQQDELLSIMKNEKDDAVKRQLQILKLLPTEKIIEE